MREYYDATGNRITTANLGDTVTVKIFARTKSDTDFAENVAITDLLPCGFIPNTDSITGDMNFATVLDDRIIIYANLTRDDSVFTYTAQVGTAGQFIVPAIHAESMYNPQISATGDTDTFTVINESTKQ